MSSETITSNDLKNILNGLLPMIYPVGAYYETSDPTFNPNVEWGGIWELEVGGQVHVSSGSYYTIDGATTNTSDGGERAHTLTTSEIPAHTHGSKSLTGSVRIFKGNQATTSSGILSFASMSKRQYTTNGTTTNSWQTMTVNATHEHTSVGSGAAHNNMQPYIVVNRWHRTA
jgi:hypothetical protein